MRVQTPPAPRTFQHVCLHGEDFAMVPSKSARMTGERASASKPSPATDRALPPVLLALTLTTGLIDAASYLGLGHVFTANMTGNIVLLGFGLAHAGGLPVLAPAISLAAFLIG